MTAHTYTINRATFDGKFFRSEMKSELLAIFNDYTIIVDQMTITFASALTASQKLELDSQMGSHPSYEPYQIYKYLITEPDDDYDWPIEIDYIISLDRRLYDKKTRVFGELQKVEYFEDRLDNGDGTFTYSTPVVIEQYTYVRDAVTGFPVSRSQDINWYYKGGSLDNKTKTRTKYYNDDSSAAISELIRVRSTNILDIVNSIIPLILITDPAFNNVPSVITEGRRFFDKYATQRTAYEKDGNYSLTQAVKDEVADFTWLDNDIAALAPPLLTIRSLIIYNLTNGAET